MKLTPSVVAALPLAAAAVDRDNEVLAQTPEWSGPGLGTVIYGVGTTSLMVTPIDQSLNVTVLVDELLMAMKQAAKSTADDFAVRLAVRAAALELIVGRQARDTGTVGQVVGLLKAMAEMHPGTSIELRRGNVPPSARVRSPGGIAMALHQLIRNAWAHDEAAAVLLQVSSQGPGSLAFSLEWVSRTGGQTQPLRTSRSIDRRVASNTNPAESDGHRHWGLGYVAIAADALGAVRTGPMVGQDGITRAVFEFGVPRLMLPIACVRDWRVIDTTPGWESEELNCPRQGEPLGLELEGVIRDAKAAPGQIVSKGSWLARHVRDKTYVALPPDGMTGRARDIIVGYSHEQEIWQVQEPVGTVLNALLVLVSLVAGQPEEDWLVSPDTWFDSFTSASLAFGLPVAPPQVTGPPLDARAVAYLYWRYGIGWGRRPAEDAPDGLLTLKIRPEFINEPVLAALGAQDGELAVEWSPSLMRPGAARVPAGQGA